MTKKEYFGGGRYVKDVRYLPAEKLTESACCAALALWGPDIQAVNRAAIGLLHVKRGCQLWVSKEVSDDLLAASVDEVKFEDVAWPHYRMEVYFEDRDIPTLLVSDTTMRRYMEELNDLTGTKIAAVERSDNRVMHIQLEERGTLTATSMAHRPEELNAYAMQAEDTWDSLPEAEKVNAAGAFSRRLEMEDKRVLQHMLLLFYKVLLYCASEGCAPRRTVEQPTKAQGGKAGFLDRPKRPRLLVEYLPRQKKQRADEARALQAKEGHRFLGRRGHWRVYRHERYTTKQGERQFIYPLPGPDGTYPKKKFVVIKHDNTQITL
jgi:hypothetical protein